MKKSLKHKQSMRKL